MERTLVLIKPDGVQRNLTGEIIKRLESRGLQIVGLKFLHASRELAEEHYKVHKGKPFYEGLVKYITSSPLVAIVFEGPEAINAIRQSIGDKNPVLAAPGTIRHDLAIVTSRNLVHASDSPETARIEIQTWFNESELFSWKKTNEDWFTGIN